MARCGAMFIGQQLGQQFAVFLGVPGLNGRRLTIEP